jgi:hypothetical protein
MSDYTDLLTRLNSYLHDSGSLIYASSYLDEGMNQALDAISNAMGSTSLLTITGFKSAAATTLPTKYFSIFIQGAAAYSIIGRSVIRAEITNLNQQVPDSIVSLARLNLSQFEKDLEIIRQSVKSNSITPPYPSGDDAHWPLDDFDGDSVF